MSDDNGFVEEEEVDVLSLLASESEDEGDEEDDDAGEVPESIEELKKALEREREIKRKRNKSLKVAKQAQHRTQKEYDALLARLEKVEERASSATENNGVAKLEQQAQEWRDRVEDDPSQAVGYTDWKFEQFEDRMARYLGEKFGSIESMISEWRGQTDPERVKYASQIDALRKSGLDMDDNTLISIAKVLGSKKVKTPRGSIGGLRDDGAADASSKRGKISDDDMKKIREAVRAGMN